MSALAIILVPAGIIAALICFRWARWTAIAFVLFAAWWLSSAHANDGLWKDQETQKQLMARYTEKFCSSASSLSCSAYQSEAFRCYASLNAAGSYLINIRMWEAKGLSPRQAATFGNLSEPWLAELAAEAPRWMSPAQFMWHVMNDCLEQAAQR